MKYSFSFFNIIYVFALLKFSNSQNILSYLFSPKISSLIPKKNISLDANDFYYNQIFDESDREKKEKEEKTNLRGMLFEIIRNEIESINISKSNISQPCKNIINKYVLGHYDPKNYSNISYLLSNYNLIKILDDTSKNRNFIGTFHQCMYKTYKLKEDLMKIDERYIMKDKTLFTYIILSIDQTKNEDSNAYNITIAEIEFKRFLIGLCMPQGYDLDNEYCEFEDYKNLILYINNELDDILKINKSKITGFTLRINPHESEKDSDFQIILSMLPFIFFAFQACFVFFRFIYIQIKKNCKNNKIDKIKNEPAEEFADERISDIRESTPMIMKNIPQKKNNFIKEIGNCFDLLENALEMFDFAINSTKYNNDSGLNIIRGIYGISLIFILFGFTFVALYNSPLKVYSPNQLIDFLMDNYVVSSILIISIRYSPRIILSCSGYILVYKYLSYLDEKIRKNKENIFKASLKFISYQIHKIILFFILLLFERYSAYYLFYMFNTTVEPMFSYLKVNILQQPDILQFLSYFTIFRAFIPSKEQEYSEGNNLLDYFWMPFNEIIFFLIGVLIISVGFKNKWRFDIFILCLIPSIFITKVVISYLIFYKNFTLEENYSTMFYVFYNYGRFMINPFFNLPYYLIGMYFGLINYAVQKGIISLYAISKINLYKSKKDLNNIITNKNEEDEIETNSDLENTFSNDGCEEKDFQNKEYREELINMPFLILPIKFFLWHKQQNKIYLYIIFLILILLFFIFTFIIHIQYIINSTNEYEDEALNNALKNDFVNFIYRIDIEFVVLFVHWGLFYIIMKANSIATEFLGNIFWIILSRPYFSYILVINTFILFMFYHDETLIEMNTIYIFMYSIIAGAGTFIFTSFFYIFFELPYKRMIKVIYKRFSEKNEENETKEENDIFDDEEEEEEIIDNNNDKDEKIKNE